MGDELEVLPGLPGTGAAFARSLLTLPGRAPTLAPQAVMVAGYRQDRAQLAEYLRVCGFRLRDQVPPTWLHVLAFPLHLHLLTDPATTLRLPGLLHVANSMQLLRPVSQAEPLDLVVQATDLRPHRRGAQFDLRSQVRVDDEPVWQGTSTYLATGVSVPGEAPETQRSEFEPVTPRALWRLPGSLGRQYRAVSGDPNPIHTSRLAARALGFSRPIAHGMWTHARVLAALENRLPPAYQVQVEFTKPIPLPGTVGFSAARQGDAWRAAVTTRDGARPHLLAAIEPQ